MRHKWIALCVAVCLALALSACSPADTDAPLTENVQYGCQPQATLSVFDNSYAIAPDGSDWVYYKNIATGALMRADRNFENASQLSEGEIVGIGYEDGALFYARVVAQEDESTRSELVRADANGENPEIILSTDRTIRQMLIVDRLIYFVAYDEDACELWRCNLRGQSQITVAGGNYYVGDYTVNGNTIYFNMAWAEEAGDYTTYRCGISGDGITATGFRRGGSFFFAGDALYSAVPYGEDRVMLEILNTEDDSDEPYLMEAGGSMVTAFWFTDQYLYFSLTDSRNINRIHLETREVEELYTEAEGENYFTGLTVAAGRLVLCDAQGGQFVADIGQGDMTLSPLG